jgi:hypothetical protein
MMQRKVQDNDRNRKTDLAPLTARGIVAAAATPDSSSLNH